MGPLNISSSALVSASRALETMAHLIRSPRGGPGSAPWPSALGQTTPPQRLHRQRQLTGIAAIEPQELLQGGEQEARLPIMSAAIRLTQTTA